MKTVAQILKTKARQDVATVTPDATASNAAWLMTEHGVGALLVMENGKLLGILSERDFARKVVPFERPGSEIRVAEIMSAPVMCVDSGRSEDECMAMMTQHRLRHLPVLEGGRLVGLVSIGDLVKNVIADQQFIIEQLEQYIVGTPA